MKRLSTKLSYTLYILLAVVFTSCYSIEAERDYNKRYWEIKKMRLELDYLKDLHGYKSDIKFEKKIEDIDRLISNYR
jgi:hypothetical protein